MENKKILYVYTGDHYVHRKFAESFTEESIKSSWKIPLDKDFYFCEGEFFKLIILRMLGILNKNSKIIALFSDPRLFYLDTGFRFNVEKQKLEKYSKIRKFLFNFFLKRIDGAICVGKFEEALLKKYFKGPVKVVYPFIQEQKLHKLKEIKPNLNGKNILYITTWGDHYCKGLDYMISIFDELKKEIPEIKLYVLGKVELNKKWEKKDLYFEGYKNVEDYFKKSALTLHFGRGESFGINILESLISGVPAIVSEYTGAKEVIARINPKFIVPFNKKEVILEIKNYFNKDLKRKKFLSEKGRKITLEFNEREQLEKFKVKFKELIEEIK